MLQRTPPQSDLSEIVRTARNLLHAARRDDGDDFRQEAERLCAIVSEWHGSRLLSPMAIDSGLAVSTIVKHEPRKQPQTKEPRVFDTLFFAALFLMEVAGKTVTFQWRWDGRDRKGRYYLRGEFSSAARSRFYVARIILDAEPGSCAQFDEDHHSYRLRDLIQRQARGGLLPDGKLGRQAAIKRSSEGYATKHHESLSPDDYSRLLTDLLTTATTFHGSSCRGSREAPARGYSPFASCPGTPSGPIRCGGVSNSAHGHEAIHQTTERRCEEEGSLPRRRVRSMTHKPMSVYNYRKLKDLLRFLHHTGIKMEEALALQRKHFTGLGTDKAIMLKPRKCPLVSSADNFIINRIGLEGDPEDYVLPRYLYCPPPPV